MTYICLQRQPDLRVDKSGPLSYMSSWSLDEEAKSLKITHVVLQWLQSFFKFTHLAIMVT